MKIIKSLRQGLPVFSVFLFCAFFFLFLCLSFFLRAYLCGFFFFLRTFLFVFLCIIFNLSFFVFVFSFFDFVCACLSLYLCISLNSFLSFVSFLSFLAVLLSSLPLFVLFLSSLTVYPFQYFFFLFPITSSFFPSFILSFLNFFLSETHLPILYCCQERQELKRDGLYFMHKLFVCEMYVCDGISQHFSVWEKQGQTPVTVICCQVDGYSDMLSGRWSQ